MTKWSEHVKKHAKKHKMSYREASMDSKCKESYRKVSKKRMSPRKVSKKRMSPRKMSKKRMSPKKRGKRKMNAFGGLDNDDEDIQSDAEEIQPFQYAIFITDEKPNEYELFDVAESNDEADVIASTKDDEMVEEDYQADYGHQRFVAIREVPAGTYNDRDVKEGVGTIKESDLPGIPAPDYDILKNHKLKVKVS